MAGKGQFREGVNSYLESLGLHSRVKSSVTDILETFEGELEDIVGALIDQYGLDPKLKGMLNPRSPDYLQHKHQIGIAILIAVLSGIVGAVVSPTMKTTSQSIERGFNEADQHELAPTNVLLYLLNDIPQWYNQLIKSLQQQGYGADAVTQMVRAMEFRFKPEQYIALWLRKEINDAGLKNGLDRLNVPEFEQEKLRVLANYIPNVGDLISMAVRDAFNEEASKRFGYDDNFPSGILEFTRAQGLTDEWTHRYWRAHWQLPSIGQAFEMFQRLRPDVTKTPFNQQDLESLLVTADVPSFFRERLTQIAYNPVTRVDIRRLYRMGIYKEKDVYNAYLDGGYSPENAQNLTKFTVQDAIDDDSGITRSTILSAFRKGYINYTDALSRMIEAGHSDVVAKFYLNIETHNINERHNDVMIDYITTQYVEGIIDDQTMMARLDALGIIYTEREVIVFNARTKRENKIVLPSKNDVDEWYSQRIIGDGEYTNYLVRRGYNLSDAQRYLRSINAQIAAKAQDTAEAAAKAWARIQKENEHETYQKAVARIDLDIAQLNLQIANIKVAISKTEDDDILSALRDSIPPIESQIKQKQVQKAQLKV